MRYNKFIILDLIKAITLIDFIYFKYITTFKDNFIPYFSITKKSIIFIYYQQLDAQLETSDRRNRRIYIYNGGEYIS